MNRQHTNLAVLVLATLACAPPSARGLSREERIALQAAKTFLHAGQEREAFASFLAVPGAEHEAASRARPHAKEFLELLRRHPRASPRTALVEADLLLALGQENEARQILRRLAIDGPAAQWGTESYDYYPVEVREYGIDHDLALGGFARGQLLEPFTAGPGSHRDNWLLRRLLALDLDEEAAAEYARIWQAHRANTLPYVAVTRAFDECENEVWRRHRVHPAGFDGRGLLFALDYAYFLKRRGDTAAELDVLLEPLRSVDLDRNPNHVHLAEEVVDAPAPPFEERPATRPTVDYGGSAGVSRQEFLRVVHGELKSLQRDGTLVAEVERRIDSGDDRARRVLARLRALDGQPEAAMALELDYITRGKFDQASAEWRRSLVYEEFHHDVEAVACLERLLELPWTRLDVPDADEPAAGLSAREQVKSRDQTEATSIATPQRLEALARLQRLRAVMGQPDKELEATLRRLDLDDTQLGTPQQLDRLAERFKSAGREAQFSAWARRRLRDTKLPEVGIRLAWHLRDYRAAIDAIAESATTLEDDSLESFKRRFAELGVEQHRALLRAIVAANPGDSVSRLELLDSGSRIEGPDAMHTLEVLLDPDATSAFAGGKGVQRSRTRFRNHLDLAYRLMRLYEKNGRMDQLHALALRIARGEKPFEYDQNRYASLDSNDAEECGNAALALAIQHADGPRRQAALRQALEHSRWTAARAQLDRRVRSSVPSPRRMRHSPADGSSRETGRAMWRNVPGNVTLLASAESVLCLARDARFVYAGQPWGVSVYDFSGACVARLALGEAALALAARGRVSGGQDLWAGTPRGLFRITGDDGQWAIAHQALDGEDAHDNPVRTLALDGDLLWIGLGRGIQVLNTRTRELRAFSAAELETDHWRECTRIVPDADYVWADGDQGLLRYDRASGTWAALETAFARPLVRLIDIVDGQVFVDVYLDEKLGHRPAFIDRHSLTVTPIQLEAGGGQNERIDRELKYLGKADGQKVFGGYALDAAAGRLRPLGAAVEKLRKRLQEARREADFAPRLRGGREANQRYDESGQLFGRPEAPGWHGVVLPDGTRVFGAQASGVRYEYPQEDGPDNLHVRDDDDAAGGLFFVARDGGVRRVSTTADSASLRGDATFSVLFDDRTKLDWLFTSVGLARLDRQGRVREHFSRDDGLYANHVTSGVQAGGRWYFASDDRDSRHGLIAFDPATGVFTSWHSSDGLDAEAVERVEPDGARLKLTFAVERQPGDSDSLRARPGWFDPATGAFTSGGEAEKLSRSEANRVDRPEGRREPLPWLGGWVTEKLERDGKTYWCGTRGLVITRGPVELPRFARLDASPVTLDARVEGGDDAGVTRGLLDEAKRFDVKRPVPLEQLKELLTHANGFLRAEALAAAMRPVLEQRPGYATCIAGAITDPVMRVRATAVWLLSRSEDVAARAALDIAVKDSDRYIRAVAALALSGRGEHPGITVLREVLERPDLYGGFPFGADSFIGVEADPRRAHEALARSADRETFQLFMKHPPEANRDGADTNVFAPLGLALRRDPALADELLPALRDDRGERGDQQVLAERVFRHAGPPSLPALHRALTSDDPVIRSNAARGCGAIGDPSSIPHLLRALDLRSALSRASIVWALGQLKAREAVPRLLDLYTDVRNEEQRRAGFEHPQRRRVAPAQLESLRDLDAIAGDWDELEAAAAPLKAAAPDARYQRTYYPRPTCGEIREAVRQIGPAAAQEFYRALAGGKDFDERKEAAVALAECPPEDRSANVVILRNLLGDPLLHVRARAAVSLLLLDQPDLQPVLREQLAAPDSTERGEVLGQLERLSGVQLEFARVELQGLAADTDAPAGLRDRAAQLLKKPTPGQ